MRRGQSEEKANRANTTKQANKANRVRANICSFNSAAQHTQHSVSRQLTIVRFLHFCYSSLSFPRTQHNDVTHRPSPGALHLLPFPV